GDPPLRAIRVRRDGGAPRLLSEQRRRCAHHDPHARRAGRSRSGRGGVEVADKDKRARSNPRREMPDGIWLKCPDCGEILYRKEVVRSRWVCPKCGHHFRISADDYIELLVDAGTFREYFQNIAPTDPLSFRDTAKYTDRLRAAQNGQPGREAVRTGRAAIEQNEVCLAVMDFSFLGGSMGSVVGEKLARLTEMAIDEDLA